MSSPIEAAVACGADADRHLVAVLSACAPAIHAACSKFKDRRGQATVEAAFALPVLMLLILMMMQPAIYLYDLVVMRNAAAEGCRLISTSTSDVSTNEDYIRRRLTAIPDIDIFHIHSGGCTYEISIVGDEEASEVSVKISNQIKPLPLLDLAMKCGNALNAKGNLTIETEVSMATQPSWVSSSSEGSSPKGWVATL